jgi:hypothetical protein
VYPIPNDYYMILKNVGPVVKQGHAKPMPQPYIQTEELFIEEKRKIEESTLQLQFYGLQDF